MKFKGELYYITPIDTIPSILKYGILSHQGASKLLHQSIANPEVNDRREKTKVTNGLPLHQYVNLYFNARNPMMYTLKCNRDISKLCVLIIDSSVMELPESVITDENAARAYTSFKPYPEGLDMLDFELIYERYWKHPDDPIMDEKHEGIMCSETLIPNCVGNEYIIGAYVLNSEVKDALIEVGFKDEIKIDPDIFFGGTR